MLIPFCFTINPYDIQHESPWITWQVGNLEGILISCIGQFFAGLTVVREPQFLGGHLWGYLHPPPPRSLVQKEQQLVEV